jgi:hypothetical protein
MDEIEEAPRPGESDFRPRFPSTRRRAARLIDRFGADYALALLDRRAERCIERVDLPSAIPFAKVVQITKTLHFSQEVIMEIL